MYLEEAERHLLQTMSSAEEGRRMTVQERGVPPAAWPSAVVLMGGAGTAAERPSVSAESRCRRTAYMRNETLFISIVIIMEAV